ncbi:hypothetical protein D3C87_1410100 [compost metagenome]
MRVEGVRQLVGLAVAVDHPANAVGVDLRVSVAECADVLLHGQVHGPAAGIQQPHAIGGIGGVAQLLRAQLARAGVVVVIKRDELGPGGIGHDTAVCQQHARARFRFAAVAVALSQQAQRAARHVCRQRLQFQVLGRLDGLGLEQRPAVQVQHVQQLAL